MSTDPATIYDQFPYPRPDAGPDLLHDVSHALLLALRNARLPGWQVLDAGCGTGHRLVSLALQYPEASFLGLDRSQRSLAVARSLAEQHGARNIEFVAGDLHQLTLDRRFDLIVCSGMLHHLPDPAAGLRALTGALAPDGLLYLWLYHAVGEHDRMVERELVHLFVGTTGGPGPAGPDLGILRALDIRVSPVRYGGAADAGDLSPAVQDVLDADTYLNPIVRPMRFADVRDLCADAGLDWVTAVGVTYSGGGRLVDLGGAAGTPFHVTLPEVFPDPNLLAQATSWDNATRLRALELRLRPTGFSVLAGRGDGIDECEPWVAANRYLGRPPAEPIAPG